jgi:hypothetical protein
MKTLSALLIASVLTLGSSARAVDVNDNIAGVDLCVDDSSFTAGIGTLASTSSKLAQSLYDYFIAQAKANKVTVTELGSKTCTDFAVNLDFGATTGTPRAWYGSFFVTDATSYFSPKSTDQYKMPVTIWTTESYGVLENNVGLGDFLATEGKTLIDEFFKAYRSVN